MPPTYSLSQLIFYFFKLGSSGFGGPVALVGYMHRDLVEKRQWISDEEYKEGLALSQLAPGPLAAQLCIYLGFVHYGVLGATLCGFAFIIPSFVMVVLLGIVYTYFGGLPWMQAVFYGVGAAVIGIISISTYKLTQKSISTYQVSELKNKWMLWIMFVTAAVYTFITESESLLFFIGCGILYLFYKKIPHKPSAAYAVTPLVILAVGVGFWQYQPDQLLELGVFFAKAGAFVFGSGLAIVPFLHSGLVVDHQWLTEQQFLDAVAVAMITPGPVVITVGFIGYLIGGFPGAVVAAFATFLPCYLFTIIPAPFFRRIANNPSVLHFVDGITASIVGALAGSVVVIALRSVTDVYTLLIALATAFILFRFKKIQEPFLILTAALIGILLKSFL